MGNVTPHFHAFIQSMTVIQSIFQNPTAEDVAKWFLEAIGGAIVAEMLVQRHVEGMTWRSIGEHHGVDHKTVKSWVLAAHVKLRRHGKMPVAWESPAASPA